MSDSSSTPAGNSRPMEVIDAQVHLNQLGVDRAVAAMNAVGVDGVVLDDWPRVGDRLPNGAMRYRFPMPEDAVARFPARFAYVVRIDPYDPDLDSLMKGVRNRPGCIGVRLSLRRERKINTAAIKGFFASAERHSIPTMVYIPDRVRELEPIVREFPDLQIVIDHSGMPHVPSREADRFVSIDSLLTMARYPNVAVKWGHMQRFSADPFPYRDILEQLKRTLAAFGPRRVMWESDFTIDVGIVTWAEALYCIRAADDLQDSDKEWLLGKTARGLLRWDRLDDRVHIVVIGNSHRGAYEAELNNRQPDWRVRVVLLSTDDQRIAIQPGERCLSTVMFPGVHMVDVPHAVAAALTGSMSVDPSDTRLPEPYEIN
jgi:predicted TIM-barrel fold metal-dependent hydrolase